MAYWNRLRGDELAPDRADFDLAAIRGTLSDLFMLDLDAAHQFPFLMAGTRLNAFFCAEQLGRSFLGLWQPQDARNVAAALMTAVEAACPILAAVNASPEGYRDADIEILLLPLRQAVTQRHVCLVWRRRPHNHHGLVFCLPRTLNCAPCARSKRNRTGRTSAKLRRWLS